MHVVVLGPINVDLHAHTFGFGYLFNLSEVLNFDSGARGVLVLYA